MSSITMAKHLLSGKLEKNKAFEEFRASNTIKDENVYRKGVLAAIAKAYIMHNYLSKGVSKFQALQDISRIILSMKDTDPDYLPSSEYNAAIKAAEDYVAGQSNSVKDAVLRDFVAEMSSDTAPSKKKALFQSEAKKIGVSQEHFTPEPLSLKVTGIGEGYYAECMDKLFRVSQDVWFSINNA